MTSLLRRLLMAGAGGVQPTPPRYATWSPLNKGSDVTLSNGNLTFTYTDYPGSNARSTVVKYYGRHYWEIRVDAVDSGSNANTVTVGVWPSSKNVEDYIYNTSGVYRFYETLAVNDIIGVAFDADAGTCAITLNGVAVGEVSGSPLTMDEPWYAVAGDDNYGGAILTANFGASPLVYGPPIGYAAGLIDAEVVTLVDMPMQGANNATSFVDRAGGVWSAFGTARISTALTPEGDLYLDGANSYISRAIEAAQFAFPGDFSFRYDAYKEANGADGYDTVFSVDEGSGINGWCVEMSTSRGLYFYNNNGGGAVLGYGFNPNDSVWHNYEVRRIGDRLQFLMDGIVLAAISNAYPLTHTSVVANIGAVLNGTYSFHGHLKNVVLEVAPMLNPI